MTTAWFCTPYVTRVLKPGSPILAMRELALQQDAAAAKAKLVALEIAGNQALVKVQAPIDVIEDLAKRHHRMPVDALHHALSKISDDQHNALQQLLMSTGAMTRATSLRMGTLGDVFLLATSMPRTTPRFDHATRTVVLDGDPVPCEAIEHVDAKL